MTEKKIFQPFVAPQTIMKELTVKSILLGSLFGVIFGAATVYLALKAGLTVSASIPIAVIAITLGRKFFKTTILENNIIQTTGSAGESIASGVAFTLPGFLFLSSPDSASYFNYLTILILAIVGGMLGTLLMVPVPLYGGVPPVAFTVAVAVPPLQRIEPSSAEAVNNVG